jgi:hypothetical protein
VWGSVLAKRGEEEDLRRQQGVVRALGLAWVVVLRHSVGREVIVKEEVFKETALERPRGKRKPSTHFPL